MVRDKLGRFVKGHIPWSKGKKGLHFSPKTEFKKGRPSFFKGKKRPEITGANHPMWKGGRRKISIGYIIIYKPEHPFAMKKRGCVYEHRLVMEKHLGRYLKPSEQIHHKNGDVSDNRIENLQLFNGNGKHLKFHAVLRKRSELLEDKK